MAAHGARRLAPMVANLERILGIEALCAAPGRRVPRAAADQPRRSPRRIARLRADVPPLGEDRYLAPDLEAAAALVRDGALLAASGAAFPELGAMTPVEVDRGDGPVDPRPAAHRHLAARRRVARAPQRHRPRARRHRLARRRGSTPACCPARPRCARPSTATSIDANRAPDDASLYPGPEHHRPLPADRLRRPADLARRRRARRRRDRRAAPPAFHAPYHAALAAEIARVRARHGVAILYDCHSIRSAHPVPVRRHAARLQRRHQRRRQLRARASRPASLRVCRAATGHTYVAERPLQGRLDHAPLRPARSRRARDPDGAGAVDLPRRRGAALGLRRRPQADACAPTSATILETLAALAAELSGARHDRPPPATPATSTRRPARRSPPRAG